MWHLARIAVVARLPPRPGDAAFGAGELAERLASYVLLVLRVPLSSTKGAAHLPWKLSVPELYLLRQGIPPVWEGCGRLAKVTWLRQSEHGLPVDPRGG